MVVMGRWQDVFLGRLDICGGNGLWCDTIDIVLEKVSVHWMKVGCCFGWAALKVGFGWSLKFCECRQMGSNLIEWLWREQWLEWGLIQAEF